MASFLEKVQEKIFGRNEPPKPVYNLPDDLFTAIECHQIKIVQEICSDPNLDINMRDEREWTPLHAACLLVGDYEDEILTSILDHNSK
jgi:hypothetical protein